MTCVLLLQAVCRQPVYASRFTWHDLQQEWTISPSSAVLQDVLCDESCAVECDRHQC